MPTALQRTAVCSLALAVLTGCAPADSAPPTLADDTIPRVQRVQTLLETLAADSMEGRRAGTPGELKAVRVLEAELERYGVEPAGTEGYRQPVHLIQMDLGEGRTRWALLPEGADRDTLPAERLRTAYNVLGRVPGSDPEFADEIVVVGAHHDHVGIGPAVEGDSIYNGADDDASGSVAALEIAREFAQSRARGEGPGRTILVAFFTAEEMGLVGTRYWIDNPTVPFDDVVADLQIEMIARPDSLTGGFGRGWLTGYERSTMGDILAAQGSPIVPDPRPEMRFFFRSDNLPFAQLGIPAHTLSSYNLHQDYHQPSDEAELADYPHMTALVEAAIAMMEALTSGPTPEWKEGGRPEFPGSASAAPVIPDSAWVALLAAGSLDGWTPKIRGEAAGQDARTTFRMDDEVLQVRYDDYDAFGERFGHLFFDTSLSHYRLRLEYRFVGDWLGDTPAWARRNSGVMFHAQAPETMPPDQDFPISLEAQFLGELEAGAARPTMNLCTPGTHVVYDGALDERHCIESSSATYPAGEWVPVELVVLGDSLVQHLVDGEVVLEYGRPVIGGGVVNGFDPASKRDGSPLGSGYIALQAEGQPLDFRNVRLMQLKGCMDPDSPAYRDWYVEPDQAGCAATR